MISLIVATIERVEELERLLTSLDRQRFKEFEVIVVDQNQDDRLEPILAGHPRLSIRHLRSPRGLSIARNQGLRFAAGEIVAFPDDDCWYPGDLLQSVKQWFDAHGEFDLLSAMARSADQSPAGPKWPSRGCVVTRQNIWACSVSTTIFLRKRVCDLVGEFDESIGVGAKSKYQSGEETDYLLRAMERGRRMWFEPGLTVHHPQLHGIGRLKRVTYRFALGSGYILRRHHYALRDVANQFVRSFGGAALSLLKGNLDMAEVYVSRGLGQVVGYICGPAQAGATATEGHERV